MTNKSRYGNTYSFVLSHHKIECLNGKPVALDVSLGNVSVKINTKFVDEAAWRLLRRLQLPSRGYYQRKDKTELPQGNHQGIQEFNFVDGTTVWWLTRAGVLPFRVVTRREFLQKQIEILQSHRAPAPAKRLAYYQGLLSEAPDEVAIVKEIEVASLNGTPTSSDSGRHGEPRLRHRQSRLLRPKPTEVGATAHPHQAQARERDIAQLHWNRGSSSGELQKLRDIVRANLAELRSMVK